MTAQTLFVALPFQRAPDGLLSPREARTCGSREDAVAQAATLGARFSGAVAFSRTIDAQSGTVEDTDLIRTIGDVPSLAYLF